MEVQQFAFIAEGLEAVREPGGNDEGRVLPLAQQLTVPLKKCGGPISHVDGNVEHLAAKAGDELGFRIGRSLIVETPHGPPLGRSAPVDLRYSYLTD